MRLKVVFAILFCRASFRCSPSPFRVENDDGTRKGLWYSRDYCCVFSLAEMLNATETTFTVGQTGAEVTFIFSPKPVLKPCLRLKNLTCYIQ